MKLRYKDKQYEYSFEMDFEKFLKVNRLNKYNSLVFEAFKFFEDQYILNKYEEDK